jgi:hypothetical protein
MLTTCGTPQPEFQLQEREEAHGCEQSKNVGCANHQLFLVFFLGKPFLEWKIMPDWLVVLDVLIMMSPPHLTKKRPTEVGLQV